MPSHLALVSKQFQQIPKHLK